MNESKNSDFDLKVIVLGHVSTGKTSYVSRLTQDIYINNPISTNNVQFYEKRMIIFDGKNLSEEEKTESNENLNTEEEDSFKATNDEKSEKKKYNIHLKIWDTAGAERYMSITKSYLRDSSIILLFFDINSRESFLNLDKHWWQMLCEGGYVDSSVIFLVCNKCDLKQVVTDEEIEIFCKNHNNIPYIKVSPKDNVNVTESIQIAIQEYLKMIDCNQLNSNSNKKVELGEPLDEKNELIEDSQASEQTRWNSWCKC